MKMGVGTRIIFSIFILVIVVLCVGIILAAFGVFTEAQVTGLTSGFATYSYIWAIAAAVVMVVGICLLFFGISKKGNTENSVILAATADGSVAIGLSAIEELAARHLNEVYGIITHKIKISVMSDRNVRVDLYLSVKPDVKMPEITETVINGLKEYIEKYSGINAGFIGIKVLPIKSPSPTR